MSSDIIALTVTIRTLFIHLTTKLNNTSCMSKSKLYKCSYLDFITCFTVIILFYAICKAPLKPQYRKALY